MDKSKLKKFAQYARRTLIKLVGSKLAFVLATDSAARRESPAAVLELEKEIKNTSEERTIEKIAYIWFNRFCALRFMDVNRYTRIGILSPLEGQFQPEILSEAKKGYIDEELVSEKIRQRIIGLLNGKLPSRDPQNEAYSQLLVSVCNYYSRIMPFLFQKISDYTELLIPDDLLSGNSIPTYVREALTPDACKDVEVIGWLYQFYISEKKDKVFEDLSKNKKVSPENIPAATQSFTPHYIVRYLVDNSLGRLWLLNHPDSRIFDKVGNDYYIPPVDKETDFLKITSPEEIKICDPACGSGHMLTYSFDLLYAIYDEVGYDPTKIPTKILENNLYGIEIDERAGELAAFALMMKARSHDKRIFDRKNSSGTKLEPNICVLRSTHFEPDELKKYSKEIGTDLLVGKALETLHQFEEADNFGSLIRPIMSNPDDLLRTVATKKISNDLFVQMTHNKVKTALSQADYLTSKYHVVITNPPYMGGGGMNGRLSSWVKENYPSTKSDLFAMFIERNLDLALKQGSVAMITMQSWMFLSSYEKLRTKLLNIDTILSMAHLGAHAFDSIGGQVVSTTAFILGNNNRLDYLGCYLRLVDFNSEAKKEAAIHEAIINPDCGWYFCAKADDFKEIPSSPIAYWIKGIHLFKNKKIGDIFVSGGRNKTHDNEKYLRYFWETESSNEKWKPYANGGDFRKYAGNELQVVDWSIKARNFYESLGGLCNPKYLDKEGITWSLITSARYSFRIKPSYSLYSSGSPTIFNSTFQCDNKVLAFLNSPISQYYLNAINPTLNTTVNAVFSLPFLDDIIPNSVVDSIKDCISTSKSDWDSYETSWDFSSLPLLQSGYRKPLFADSYNQLLSHWQEMTQEMQRLEEENNQIFIEAYGLQDELTPDVPLEEITLTCNPHYRYSGSKSDDELEALLLKDTMEEFISYAVGCMFGRYSLDKPGLILANHGETVKDYQKQVSQPSFPPDEDNVIPILDGDWFTDDISERFFKFLKITFGEKNYSQNLEFIESAIGKDVRKYFLKDFYSDHVQRYKKRPIYWMFSSPRGSFNVLVYMHRYRPDTVSVILNEYLREFRTKITARKDNLEQVSISSSASSVEKTKALKEIEKLRSMIEELNEYERDVLYPLATKQIEIDLDDGVVVNYNKFGEALKAVTGLTGK